MAFYRSSRVMSLVGGCASARSRRSATRSSGARWWLPVAAVSEIIGQMTLPLAMRA
jgi:hypothetical protein